MDSWSTKELECMKVGGNSALKAFWKVQGFPPGLSIEQKYSAPVMDLYRERIKALGRGERPKPIPNMGYSEPDYAKPKPKATRQSSGHRSGSNGSRYGSGGSNGGKYGGMGSSGSSGSSGGQHVGAGSDDLWNSLSDSFFSAANYTKKATVSAAAVVSQKTKETVAVIQEKSAGGGDGIDMEAVKSQTAQAAAQSWDTTQQVASAGWSTLSTWVTTGVNQIAKLAGDENGGQKHTGDVYPGATKGKFQAFGSDAYNNDEEESNTDSRDPGATKDKFAAFGSDSFKQSDLEGHARKGAPLRSQSNRGGSSRASKPRTAMSRSKSGSAMNAEEEDDWDWGGSKKKSSVKSRRTSGTKRNPTRGKKKALLVQDNSGGEDDDVEVGGGWGDDDLGLGDLALDEPKKPKKVAAKPRKVEKVAKVLEAPAPKADKKDDGWDDDWWNDDDDTPAAKVTVKSRRH
jgi:hypothetical protein